MQKKSACGEHIVIEIRLVMLIKCNFSAPAAGQNHSVFEFYDCLQGATRQATLLLMLTRFRRGQKTFADLFGLDGLLLIVSCFLDRFPYFLELCANSISSMQKKDVVCLPPQIHILNGTSGI